MEFRAAGEDPCYAPSRNGEDAVLFDQLRRLAAALQAVETLKKLNGITYWMSFQRMELTIERDQKK